MMLMTLVMAGFMALVPGQGMCAGEIAEISSTSGLVRVARATSVSDWIEAKPAMPLFVLDKVKTLEGTLDRAEVRFANGSVIRLGSRTTLEIRDVQKDSRGVIRKIASRLLGGLVRAVIKKVEGNDEFTITSNHAIASVKGCDFVFDGSTVTVIDEGDAETHKILLSDLAGTKVLEILEGMYGAINDDGTVVEPTSADPRFLDQLLHGVSGGQGSQGGQGQGGGQNAIDPEELRADLADFVDSQNMGEILDSEERINDIQAGKVLIDMNGYRVRAEQYVFQPSANQIEYLVLNTREGGPNAGLTYLQSDLTFNQDLPANYEDIRRGLSAAMADPMRYPEYFLTGETFRVESPAGDYVRRTLDFGAPEPVFAFHQIMMPGGYDGAAFTWNYNQMGQPTGWGQTAEKWLFVGTADAETPKEHFRYDRYGNIEKGWFAGCNPIESSGNIWMTENQDPDIMHNMYSVDTILDTQYNMEQIPEQFTPRIEGMPAFNNPLFATSGGGTRTSFTNGKGGVTHRTTYGDGTILDASTYAITDEGMLITPAMLGAVATGAADPSILGDSLNFEVVYEASEFLDNTSGLARDIDLVIIPGLFGDSGGIEHPEMEQLSIKAPM